MQTSILGIGYAYDSHLSYPDHLRIADSARAAGAAAGEAIEHGAERVEKGIAAAASQITGAVSKVNDAVNDVSSEVRAATEVMQWGFSSMLDAMAEMKTTLGALLKCAREPSQTWAYEQFDIARDNFRKGNYEDSLKRLGYAIDGYQTHLGYPEGWQLHQLRGDIYLQCPRRSLIDLPKAEKCFLAAAQYADTSHEKAMALTAAAVAAYNQGHMDAAERYARQACEARRDLADAHFQLARIRLNKRNYIDAWQAALEAITLDHRYAARLPLDSEFRRNASGIKPAWRQYAKDLKARLVAESQSAAAAMHELAKSREETNRMRNSHAFEFFDSAGKGLAEAKSRFQRMTELVNTLSPKAQKSLKSLADILRGNSVFAFLEAERLAKNATDLATRAFAASREAELTLRKVEQLSQGLPDSFPFKSDHATESTWGLIAFLVGGGLFSLIGYCIFGKRMKEGSAAETIVGFLLLIPYLFGVAACARAGARRDKEVATKKAMKEGIESFDWSAANAPQTTAATDGTMPRANL